MMADKLGHMKVVKASIPPILSSNTMHCKKLGNMQISAAASGNFGLLVAD